MATNMAYAMVTKLSVNCLGLTACDIPGEA
jgi:hypothetical protein